MVHLWTFLTKKTKTFMSKKSKTFLTKKVVCKTMLTFPPPPYPTKSSPIKHAKQNNPHENQQTTTKRYLYLLN